VSIDGAQCLGGLFPINDGNPCIISPLDGEISMDIDSTHGWSGSTFSPTVGIGTHVTTCGRIEFEA